MNDDQKELIEQIANLVTGSRLNEWEIIGVLHYLATAYTMSLAETIRRRNEAKGN